MNVCYAILLILSTTKRSFEALGKILGVSGDTIRRLLPSREDSFIVAHGVAQMIFATRKNLTLVVDDTLVNKIHSKIIRGTGMFYHTGLGRKMLAFRVIVAVLTDGKYTIPIDFGYMFAKELLKENDVALGKTEFIQRSYDIAKRLFPTTVITIAADGLFATIEFLQWCTEHNIHAVVRMHSNRKVLYNGVFCTIREIKAVVPRGRQMARTIQAIWHGVPVYITAERRIDKSGKESIVYLAATYRDTPQKYVKGYKKRWPIEKFFRTTKQHLGLAECFSTRHETQEKHTAAVIAAYAITQWEMRDKKLQCPEEAIRRIKRKKYNFLNQRFSRLDRIFGAIHA